MQRWLCVIQMARTERQVVAEAAEEEKRFRLDVIERLDRLESIFLPIAEVIGYQKSRMLAPQPGFIADTQSDKSAAENHVVGDIVDNRPEAEFPAFENAIGLQGQLLEMVGDLKADYAVAWGRGEAAGAALAQDPDLISATDLAERLRITKAAVHQKRKKGEILGVSFGPQKYWFPTWQIDRNGRLLAGLQDVHDAFHGDAFAVYRFLQMRHPELGGRTGMAALASGDKDVVLTTIAGMWNGAPA